MRDVFATAKFLIYGDRSIFKMVAVRHLNFGNFHFWSRDVHPVQKLLCTKFHQNRMIFHWNMAIYWFSKWRLSAILELFYRHTRHSRSLCCWPQLPVKFHVNLIHTSEDIAIWIFSHIWLEMPLRVPKMFFWNFGPLKVIIHHRDFEKAHPCVNPRLLSYQL